MRSCRRFAEPVNLDQPLPIEGSLREAHLMQDSFFLPAVALCGAQDGELVRKVSEATCARCKKLARELVADHIAPLVVSLG